MDIDVKKIYLIFQDAFVSNTLLSVNNEVLIFIGAHLTENKLLLLLIGLLAFTLSTLLNYFLGTLFFILCNNFFSVNNLNSYCMLQKFYSKNGKLICLLTGMHFLGKFIPFIAGFIKYNIYYVISISIMSKLIYYILNLL